MRSTDTNQCVCLDSLWLWLWCWRIVNSLLWKSLYIFFRAKCIFHFTCSFSWLLLKIGTYIFHPTTFKTALTFNGYLRGIHIDKGHVWNTEIRYSQTMLEKRQHKRYEKYVCSKKIQDKEQVLNCVVDESMWYVLSDNS